MNEVPKSFNRVSSIRSNGPAKLFYERAESGTPPLAKRQMRIRLFFRINFLQSPGRFAQPTDQRFARKRFSEEVALGEVAVHLIKPV